MTAATADWHRPADVLPPEGVEVAVLDSTGQASTLVYDSGLWWFPDRSMYVYCTPTFWRLP